METPMRIRPRRQGMAIQTSGHLFLTTSEATKQTLWLKGKFFIWFFRWFELFSNGICLEFFMMVWIRFKGELGPSIGELWGFSPYPKQQHQYWMRDSGGTCILYGRYGEVLNKLLFLCLFHISHYLLSESSLTLNSSAPFPQHFNQFPATAIYMLLITTWHFFFLHWTLKMCTNAGSSKCVIKLDNCKEQEKQYQK